MAKKRQAPLRFEVLRPVRNDKKDTYFGAGETITTDDFESKIIRGWLAKDPPVLKELRHGR